MRQVLALVHYGIPWEVALRLPASLRSPWLVALGEMDGGQFDYERLVWKEPR